MSKGGVLMMFLGGMIIRTLCDNVLRIRIIRIIRIHG